MRPFLLLPALSCILTAQQPLSIEAPIARVRLHPDEAWVTRVAKVRLPAAGTFKLQIEDLPNGLRIEDLQAGAKGPAGLRLGDIALASDVRTVMETPEWKKLEGEREAVRDKIDVLGSQSEATAQEIVFLKGIQATHDKELSGRLAYALPPSASLVEFGRNLSTRLADLLQQEKRRRREIEKLEREEGRISAELQKRSNLRRTAPSRVTIELTTSQEGTAELELAYRTRNARWKPIYEARLSENRKKLDLVLYASVTQNTGENWDNTRLEISNARPSRSLAVPTYTSAQLVDWMKQLPPPPPTPSWSPAPKPAAAPSPVSPSEVNQVMLNRYIQPEAPAVEAEESSAAVLEEASGLAATFLVDGAKQVPSDNEPHRFRVQSREIEPTLTLLATPRLDPTAYLMARFSSPSGMPLFPGSPVIRFAGNQRLGEAALVLPSAGQPFSLGFGPYKSMRVSFRRTDEKLEQAGSFSKDRQWAFREQIELEHEGTESVEIEIQDRILKSANDQIRITLLPEFSPGWTEALPGVRSWKFVMPPKGQKRLDMPIQVRAPKDGIVTGLDELIDSGN